MATAQLNTAPAELSQLSWTASSAGLSWHFSGWADQFQLSCQLSFKCSPAELRWPAQLCAISAQLDCHSHTVTDVTVMWPTKQRQTKANIPNNYESISDLKIDMTSHQIVDHHQWSHLDCWSWCHTNLDKTPKRCFDAISCIPYPIRMILVLLESSKLGLSSCFTHITVTLCQHVWYTK